MKKIGKKLSFLTKVLMITGLLISNLASLTNVYAAMIKENLDFTVILDEEANLINVKYTGDEYDATMFDSIKLKVTEEYTYLGDIEVSLNTSSSYMLDDTTYMVEDLFTDGIDAVSGLLPTSYDGTLRITVEATGINQSGSYTAETDLGYVSTVQNIKHDSGLKFTVFEEGTVIEPNTEGIYELDPSKSYSVSLEMLLGGIRYNGDYFLKGAECGIESTEYCKGNEISTLLIDSELPSSTLDFSENLYGYHENTISLEEFGNVVVDEETSEESITPVVDMDGTTIDYTATLSVKYGEYSDNDDLLNTSVDNLELQDTYTFMGNKQDGILAVNPLIQDDEESVINEYTLLDVNNILNDYMNNYPNGVKFNIYNPLGNDIYEEYELINHEETPMELNDYLDSLLLEDGFVIEIVDDDSYITYTVTYLADANGDGVLSIDDLDELIKQILNEDTMDKMNLYNDENVDYKDAIYLNDVLQKGWNQGQNEALDEAEEYEDAIDTRLDLVTNPDEIVTGSEFNVNYVVSVKDYELNGIGGLVSFDDTYLQLVDIQENNSWVGTDSEGKFLYLGQTSLTGNQVLIDPEDELSGYQNEVVDYVVLTLTFKALKGTPTSESTLIEILNQLFISQFDTLLVSTSQNLEVIINISSNNNLASLFINGQEIVLEENVLDYEIDVTNDVTAAELEYTLENIGANVVQLIVPEELAEGENTIVIVVEAENGDMKTYTVVVNRGEAPKVAPVANTYQPAEHTTTNIIPEPDIEETPDVEEEPKDGIWSKIIIIVLILLVIAGLIYLIFKDDNKDDDNKKIDKWKNDEIDNDSLKEAEVELVVEKTPKKVTSKSTTKKSSTTTKKTGASKKTTKNIKKGN